jgi:hypothetical protein
LSLFFLTYPLQAASCTQANPDWVYVTTITGTKSQSIDIDALVPAQFHWGIRGTYAATGDASIALSYAGQNSAGSSDNDNVVHTWIFDFEPNRYEASYGNGPFRIDVSNVINYTLNIYYDANLGNETTSITPSSSLLPSSTQNPVFSTYIITIVIVLIAATAAISLVYIRIQRKRINIEGTATSNVSNT